MAKTKAKQAVRAAPQDVDGPYLLKLVLYVIVGTGWLKMTSAGGTHIPIPIGLVIGILFARQERFQVDKKIEYAVLLVAMLVGYFAPYGLYIRL
jgi:hypothetical protein